MYDVKFKEIMIAIAEVSENEVEDIKIDSNLEDDLEMDSLMLIDLIVQLEKITQKNIKVEVISKLKSVKDILDLCEVKYEK